MTSGLGPDGADHWIDRLASAPSRRMLVSLVERLEGAGLVCALGGSGLLAALGLAGQVRDWDLTADAPIERVKAALAGERFGHKGPDDLHADQKLMLADGEVELILQFAFRTPGGVVRIPTWVSGRRDGIPLGSPEAWAVAYHLLGRESKSEALLGYLETRGADPGTIARLLEEPIPTGLASRLTALSTSRST